MTGILISVDPGDKHTGIAVWVLEQQTKMWTCAHVAELGLTEAEDFIAAEAEAGTLTRLVVERFQLYSDKAQLQTGSEFETSQLIGSLKYIARLHGIPVVLQGASIKKPTQGILRAKKAKSLAKAWQAGGHAFDAELHGFYYLVKTAGVPVDYQPNHPPKERT